jgi:SnoaL-like domain
MMSTQPDGLAKWHKFVREQDMQALAEALADDVLLRSPAIWKPKEGKATVMLYISSVARVLQDFTLHRQFVGDNGVVLEFSARVGQLSVKGVDILQFNAEGQIVDFEVMVRPANGLQALAAAMVQQLASADPPGIER